MPAIWKILKKLNIIPVTGLSGGISVMPALVADLLAAEKIDAVVHFAAESHVDRSISGPEIFVRTNVLGTQVLLEESRKHWQSGIVPDFRFLQVSTDEVYGSLGATGYFTEETSLAANSPYSASKAGADLLVRAYRETYGFPTLNTRCSNNYGPYQFPEKLIPLMIHNIVAGKAAAGLRRRTERARLAPCEGSLPRHRNGPETGAARRGLQYRRQ